MKKLKPYLLLTGKKNDNKYKLRILISLPNDLDIQELKDLNTNHGDQDVRMKARLLQVIIKSAPGRVHTEPVHLEHVIVPNRERENHVAVKVVGGDGVAIPDPRGGGVGNYDDPDGDD